MVRAAPCSSPSSSLYKPAVGFLSIAAQFEKRGVQSFNYQQADLFVQRCRRGFLRKLTPFDKFSRACAVMRLCLNKICSQARPCARVRGQF